MLRSATVGRRQISSATNPLIRCRRPAGPEAEQRLKGGRRRLPTVMAERELVEIHLELRSADTMMGADQPLLKLPIARSANGTTDRAPFRSSSRRGCVRATCLKPATGRPLNCFSPSV